MGISITPFQALMGAKGLDPRRRNGSTIPRNVPAPPGTGSFGRFVHDVGYLIDLFTDQCQIDPFALVVTSVPALLRASWEIASPDPKEVFHQLSGKSVVCTLKGEIHERDTFRNSFYDGFKTTLFRTAEVADLAVWRLFLASVLTEGLIDWQMMAQELSACTGQKGVGSSSIAQGAIPDALFAHEANGLEWLTGDPVFPAFGPTMVLAPGQTGALTWVLHAQLNAATEVPVEGFISCNETGDEVLRKTSIPKDDNTYHSVIMHYRTRNVQTEIRSWTARAFCPIEVAGHQAFFRSGFCSVRPFP